MNKQSPWRQRVIRHSGDLETVEKTFQNYPVRGEKAGDSCITTHIFTNSTFHLFKTGNAT